MENKYTKDFDDQYVEMMEEMDEKEIQFQRIIEDEQEESELDFFNELKRDFYGEIFTLKDVRNTYCLSERNSREQFNDKKKDLVSLLNQGLIEEISKGVYEIVYGSEDFGRIEEEEFGQAEGCYMI